ncbi:MAG: sensor histidine kinase [Agriterribacter sp.]
MNEKARQVGLHIAGCLLFLSLPFLFSPDRQQGFFSVFRNPGYFNDLSRYVLLILFFYLNYYCLIPKFYFSQKYLLYFVLILACFVIINYVPHLLRFDGYMKQMPSRPDVFMPPGGPPVPDVPMLNRPMPARPNGEWFSMKQNLFLFLALFFFSLVLRISNRWRKVEKENTERELSYLKAQINPHFLFNTLNSIYSLSINKSEETPAAIVKLSGMMRYVLSDAAQQYVSLEKEIDYIRDYIELQELRFGESVHLCFSVEGNLTGKQIAPLLLIAFVENAFKYGVNAEENSKITIVIKVTDDILTMQLYNHKVKTNINNADQHGLGIANTKNRLQLLYPSKHTLEIRNNEKDFDVLLTLNLQ